MTNPDPADTGIEHHCVRFLYREAELLDRHQLGDWLDLLAPEIDYRVPVRNTVSSRDGDGFSTTAFFFQEDFGSLSLRVNRLGSEYAWSENPPSRTRRMVSNIRLGEFDAETGQAVNSNLVLYSYRGDTATAKVLTAERQDVLRTVEGTLKLARRLVLLDTTILGMESLSVFL